LYLLAVQIVRFVDETFPGFVEAEFSDADGLCHKIIEKIPVITDQDLWIDSEYPTATRIACEVLERFENREGQALVRISTQKPWAIESTTDGPSSRFRPTTLHPESISSL
jgi:hypothetical protein